MKEFYTVWEVESQTNVERVNINDDVSSYGYEPQCMLTLKDPGRFSLNRLVGKLCGKPALHQFKKGDLVAVILRFWSFEKDQGNVTHVDIEKIKLVKELNDVFL